MCTKSEEGCNSSKDDFVLTTNTSSRHQTGAVHNNGCKSLHNIQEAVRASEKSSGPLSTLDYTGSEFLAQVDHNITIEYQLKI
jgi:hypothetical protein